MQGHLSDEQIQEFVLHQPAVEPALQAHVQVCELCRSKVAAYELIIAAIEQQPAPALDFNISELVLSEIETQKQRNRYWWLYLIVFGAVVITGAVIYQFRKDITALFAGAGYFFIYLAAVISLFIAIAVVIDQLKTYKTKMKIIATT